MISNTAAEGSGLKRTINKTSLMSNRETTDTSTILFRDSTV
jgi:hypothetical protein